MTTDSLHFQSAIFDLDGVITDTARLHAKAWKELVDEYLEERAGRTGESHEPFDLEVDYRRYVDGKPRQEGLRSFLESRGIRLPLGDPDDPSDRETVWGLARRKNAIFHRVLDTEGVELIGGTVELIRALRARGAATAVASSSRNCRRIVERAGIADLFEARVDGETLLETGLAGKPEPDMFVEAARRLGAEPDRSIVFEDAVSGVEAGRRGGFGLVVGVAVDASVRRALRETGADLVADTHGMDRISVDLLDAWFRERKHRRPSALARWEELESAFEGREPAIFLDYDGTLTPIVATPDRAVISPEMREVVRRLAERYPVTVVSGRGREDVARLVGLENLHFAGSHGFDISGPEGDETRVRHRVAEEVLPAVARVTERLEKELAGIEGAIVEPKLFTVAVHYRTVSEEEFPAVESTVDGALEDHPELRKAHGKKVFEIRPRLEWDKGKAVLWLLEALGLDGPDVVPLYVGDDTTDEDAFRALEGRGIGIVVARAPRPTAARYSLQDTAEVRDFLERMAER